MQAILITNDLWDFVGGNPVKPEPDKKNAMAIQTWDRNDQEARLLIILSISPSEIKQIKNCATAGDTWNRLKEIYQSKGPARKATLLKTLIIHKMAENTDVLENYKTIKIKKKPKKVENATKVSFSSSGEGSENSDKDSDVLSRCSDYSDIPLALLKRPRKDDFVVVKFSAKQTKHCIVDNY